MMDSHGQNGTEEFKITREEEYILFTVKYLYLKFKNCLVLLIAFFL